MRLAALAAAAQVSEAQLQASAQLALTLLFASRRLGWGAAGTGAAGAAAAPLGALLLPATASGGGGGSSSAVAVAARMLEAAALGYWAATAPGVAARGAEEVSDPARMVMSLTIDDTGKRKQ